MGTVGRVLDGRVLGNTDPALRRCWHPVARAEEVTDQPSRSLLLGEPWVLFRAGGRLRAFPDRCPHRRAPLSLGRCESGILRCGYHGWRFDGDGRGVEVPALGPDGMVPSRADLRPAAGVEERHGIVFVAPEPPIAPLPTIPEADDPRFLTGDLPTMSARASAGLLADNFLDMAHFPFVHRGTFGAEEAAEVPDYRVDRDGWSFTASYQHSFANREDPGVAAGLRPLVQTRRLTYRLDAPFHLVLRIDFVEAGGSNVIGFFLQPETADRCRIYSTIWRDDLDGDPVRMAQAVAFEVAVVEEDLRVQQAYDQLVLPLDLTVELHTRADRTTVELRRVLADLVAAVEAPPVGVSDDR
ncbi:MAG TPA: aromatic ring-hydroxylating dioxygenase subunit alpha [Acidimicrobiales bacterium]|jgi:vanillate O-demethylase monooxygenase subunit|nr:aromatic ring-hydroxylating dioxygenase subunit alpha [Acidimicrobiales bacterium]